MNESKNAKLLGEFMQYCSEHPELRFYQALRNFMKVPYIFVGDIPEGGVQTMEALGLRDCFYWENKND